MTIPTGLKLIEKEDMPSQAQDLSPTEASAAAVKALVDAGGGAVQMLIDLLPEAAQNVENASRDLTERFKQLAENSSKQSDMVEALLASIGIIELEDRTITLEEFTTIFHKTLDDAVSKLLFVSKKALTMVYSMDEAIKNLHEIENFSRQIQLITKQSNLLALNATIEAERAGEVGKAFAVVASEVKILSKQVSQLSEDMGSRTGVIMRSVTEGFDVLKDVATTDMNANILAKETLDILMKGMLRQSDTLRNVVLTSSSTSRETSDSIRRMIVDLQFQDRNTQITENTVEILRQCLQLVETLKVKANTAEQNSPPARQAVEEAAASIAAVIKLGEIRQRYIEVLGRSGAAPANLLTTATPPSAQSDVELF